MNGAAEIAAMMEGYRSSPPMMIDGADVTELLDYELQVGKNLQTGKTWTIDLPKSNVLQFILADGTKISARPSGTEPKIKFYFSVNAKLIDAAAFDTTEKLLDEKIGRVIEELGLK
jgi:phosphoglucomutase